MYIYVYNMPQISMNTSHIHICNINRPNSAVLIYPLNAMYQAGISYMYVFMTISHVGSISADNNLIKTFDIATIVF